MGNLAETVRVDIARRLDAALPPGMPNKVTEPELRQWAVEYLAAKDEEVAAYPHVAGLPHWNLWFCDGRLECDAQFAVLVFRPDGMELISGTGPPFGLRSWDSECPNEPDGLVAELRRNEFVVPSEGLRLARGAAEAWLGRGW